MSPDDNNFTPGGGDSAAEEAAEAEAARAARAEEKALARAARKADREKALAEKAEQRAIRKSEREVVTAQKKAERDAAKEVAAQEKAERDAAKEVAAQEKAEKEAALKAAEAKKAKATEKEEVAAKEGAVSASSAGEADAKETGTGFVSAPSEPSSSLPAKVVKEKKPKKAKSIKSSSAKGIRRAIRPIRSRSQQTTARLIWAVFGMALVIVAIVGFWVVLSGQEDDTEVDVLVAAIDLTEGNFLLGSDVAVVTLDIGDGELAYMLSSSLNSLVGRVILQDVGQGTHLSLDMFGSVPIEEVFNVESETNFPLNFPSEVTVPEGTAAGDRVIIFIRQGDRVEKFAFEVVDLVAVEGNTVSLQGSYEDRAWWDANLDNYKGQEGVTFELEIVNREIHHLCWRERFRQIYNIQALPIEEYTQLVNELRCPWGVADGTGGDIDDEGIDDGEAEPASTSLPADSVARRLENERFETQRIVPNEINNPTPTESGGGGGGDGGNPLGELGIDFPAFPE